MVLYTVQHVCTCCCTVDDCDWCVLNTEYWILNTVCLWYVYVYFYVCQKAQSVNGVVVTWNPSKVQLGVRFPLDASFFLYWVVCLLSTMLPRVFEARNTWRLYRRCKCHVSATWIASYSLLTRFSPHAFNLCSFQIVSLLFPAPWSSFVFEQQIMTCVYYSNFSLGTVSDAVYSYVLAIYSSIH